MDERNYIINLYDIYGELLTDNQRKYFEDYYFSNFTLSEIGENYNISRNGVYKQVKDGEEKIKNFESKLNIYKKNNEIKKAISKLDITIQDKIKSVL